MECACCHKIRHEGKGRKAHQVFVCIECIELLHFKAQKSVSYCSCGAITFYGEVHSDDCDALAPALYELGRFGEITEL